MMARQLGCGQVPPKIIPSWISQAQRRCQRIHTGQKDFWVYMQ
jgi:hypothetical protein